MDVEDAKIVRLCKNNKREGYNLLYEKYERYIYSLCFRYTSSREDALDLLQDIYINMYKGMPGFKKKQPLRPWIRKITVNTCLNHVNRSKEKHLSLNKTLDDNETEFGEITPSSECLEDEVIARDTKRILEKTIQELSNDMKMAIILRHTEELSYDEISKTMSLPLGTVKTLLFRGRRILKEKLLAAGVLEV